MKVVCVAEKNSIAKQVATILSGGNFHTRNSLDKYIKNYDFRCNQFPFTSANSNFYVEVTMTSVKGHISSLGFEGSEDRGGPYSWGNCDPIELYSAPVINSFNFRNVIQSIYKECRDADYLMIWTDCDREGEYIGWEIYMAANYGTNNWNIRMNTTTTAGQPKFNESNTFRAIFSHLERSHIINATRNPKKLDQKSIDAVSARMEIDLRAGLSFTRFLTNFFQNNKLVDAKVVVSYGPCQFPTLGFVVDRDDRIEKFVPENFWYLEISIKRDNTDGGQIKLQWKRGHLFDRLIVYTIYEHCVETGGATAKVTNIVSKPTSKYRPLPLTTVELQKNCAKFFKMSAKRSLDAAEYLYQKGFLSYPRTETDIFPQTMDLKALVEQQKNDVRFRNYASNLLSEDYETSTGNKFSWPRQGSHDDKAHPPIHPIASCSTENLTADQKTVYEYVTRHFLACCSQDAKGHQTSIEVQWATEFFKTTGITVLARNFLEIYPYISWKSTAELPELHMGDTVDLLDTDMKSGSTSAPQPMTESELILLMDANGIGTDATIADHIEKIKGREYIRPEKSGKQTYLRSTKLGKALVHGFEEIGLEDSFAKPFLRREMENDLKLICSGNKFKRAVVQDMVERYLNYYNITQINKRTLLSVFNRFNG
ncbi:related to DNA topoisomerase 3 [Saccharomycodes ludwigii]|uniref:DNA topoisomerase n=1 Tax=Saccharomycodes ludwigii TaxID=36035 RepID=A0A376B1E6_9ASCO|nr:hypothetical protein SCDLUD_001884 [Saccharomycodes ludwigii]KAH3902073.1 hypothetical protein SCDLUD_001884 [Saccharomycodes ludwigii]SSD58304.1 related to DNA topoisomerase 3 [Saccharomycodes ludwigii]